MSRAGKCFGFQRAKNSVWSVKGIAEEAEPALGLEKNLIRYRGRTERQFMQQ